MIVAFIQLLKSIFSTGIAADHIGRLRPSSSPQLPTIVVSAENLSEKPIGIGGTIYSVKGSEQWNEADGYVQQGDLLVEFWAGDAAGVTVLEDEVERFIREQRKLIRQSGFVRFVLHRVSVQERKKIAEQGNKFAVMAAHTYRVHFEAMEDISIGPGGIIQNVPVVLHADEAEETFNITK